MRHFNYVQQPCLKQMGIYQFATQAVTSLMFQTSRLSGSWNMQEKVFKGEGNTQFLLWLKPEVSLRGAL